jgi:hypothetical protein
VTIRYPYGYGTGTKTMTELRARYEPKMHPEFARRLFAWIESQGGNIGIGGGWRDTQPDKPGFAPEGRSFHQYQDFASGLRAYAAVDLVARNGTDKHRAPTWEETETAPAYGVHTFIRNPTPEPWHAQPTDGPSRGWSTWKNAGSPDPDPNFVLPGDEPDPEEGDDMTVRYFRFEPLEVTGPVPLFATADELHASWISADQLAARGGLAGAVLDVLDRADARRYTFVGPCPDGHYGIWGSDAH